MTTKRSRLRGLRLLYLVFAGILCAQYAYGQDLRGIVTVGGSHPLRRALVKLQAPGVTVVTKTDEEGRFAVDRIGVPEILISILVDGQLLYRSIVPIHKGETKVIDLRQPDRPPPDFTPIAVAALHENDIFVLEQNGWLARLSGGYFERLARVDGVPTGLASAIVNGAEVILATSVVDRAFNKLVRYSAAGSKLNDWTLTPGMGGSYGLAVDAVRNVAYFMYPDRWMICEHSLAGNASSQLVSFSQSADRPESLAIDQHGGRLFVGYGDGELFSISIERRRRSKTLASIGSIAALAFDGKRKWLYASSGHSIWRLDVDTPGKLPIRLVKDNAINEPTGLAVDNSGTLWVADRFNRAIFAYSPEGARRYEFTKPRK